MFLENNISQIFALNQLYVTTSTFIDQQLILNLSVLTEADICTQVPTTNKFVSFIFIFSAKTDIVLFC